MPFINVEISFLIQDSFSLKDKRSTVKSIAKRMHQRHNASLAEVAKQDVLNIGCVGISVVSSSTLVAQQTVDQIIKEIEEMYEIEIFDISYV
ncbi:DUF503 family protein [Jeotgalibaca ciconiae]|uniref:DUF503 domain-containing protein n=1 Tax=Jeotgalibaca ciconiae TaxID=2496265 RepID=A0A3S9HB34_9LACT|nr:DUF503 domain-containing protein [Jeotgalibaca ciconiae]AZP04537.1 DUF503 domain-containing protein [Jeotgalibaca ciconiae]